MWGPWSWCLLLGAGVAAFEDSFVHSDQFLQEINDKQSHWTAGKNFHPGSYVKNLYSTLPMIEEKLPVRKIAERKTFPANFDGRKFWKRCGSISKVKEQGNCASAWALVAAGVLTDRTCISRASGVRGNVEVSAQNVLACCKVCGVNCLGGYVSEALVFLAKHGAPTRRCHPYEIYGCPKCQKRLNCPMVRAHSPVCRGYCRKTYNKRPFQDLRKSEGAYSLRNSSEAIMSELMSRGPVAAVVDLYEDLVVYRGGVYRHTAGRLLAHHPVKVVGWGSQGGDPYWLAVNSWTNLWGDRGTVKIARGVNGVHLEDRVFALLPEKP